jgi:hypothetical protein
VASYWLVWPTRGPRDHLVEGSVAVEGRLGRYTVDEVVHWMAEGDLFQTHGPGGSPTRLAVCRCPDSPRPHLMLEPWPGPPGTAL